VHRYAVAEGVELLVDANIPRPRDGMQQVLRLLRQAFDADD
jgi:hypothetical protein